MPSPAPTAPVAAPIPPSVPQTPRRSRRGIFIGLVVLLVVGLSGVAAAAFLMARRANPRAPAPARLTDAEILAAALQALPDIKSGSMRFEISFNAESRDSGAQPISIALPDMAQQRHALQQDRERISEITQIMQRLEQEGSPPAGGLGGAVATSAYPKSLDAVVSNPPARTDPAGGPYRYASDGTSFTLTFHLETQAAVDAWNKQLDGARQFGPGKLPPPRVRGIDNDIVLTSVHDTPLVYLSGNTPLDTLADFDGTLLTFYQMIPSDLSASFNVRGDFQTDAEHVAESNASVGMGGRFAMGGISFAGDGELRKVGENWYGRVNEFPLPFGPVDFNAIKGQWVQIQPDDFIGVFSFDVAESSAELQEENKVEVQQYQLAVRLAQEQQVFSIGQVMPMVEQTGKRYHRYQINLDRTKFASYYRTLAERSAAEFGARGPWQLLPEQAEALESEEFIQVYDALAKNTMIEVWVEDGTNLPYQFVYSLRLVPPESVPKHAGKQFRFTASLTLDRANQPVVIEIPSPTLSVDEATALVTSQSAAVVQLMRQIRNVEAIREALEAYLVRTGEYPPQLEDLKRKPSEVAPAPVPPTAEATEFWAETRRSRQDAPFLRIIPDDRYTGAPFPYQREVRDYQLRYQVRLPPPEERAPERITLVDYNQFHEGENIADAKVISRQASAGLDTDADGLTDIEERTTYGTDPALADTDADGFPDGLEVKSGFDPTGPGRLPASQVIPSAPTDARSQPRSYDSLRLSNIKQIQTALELYYNDHGEYPRPWLPVRLGVDAVCLDGRDGAGFHPECLAGQTVYMSRIPKDPGGLDYMYSFDPEHEGQYCIEFTLGHNTAGLSVGKNYATESGISSVSCMLVREGGSKDGSLPLR